MKKIISLYIFIGVLFQNSSAQAVEEAFQNLWNSLLERNQMNQLSLDNDLALQKAQMERLKNQQSIRYSPSIQSSYNSVMLGTHAAVNELSWQSQTLSASMTLQSNDEEFTGGSGKVAYNALANIHIQLEYLAKNQKLISQRNKILRDNILFTSLKWILSQKMALRLAEQELEVRKGLDHKAQGYLDQLMKFVKLGISATNDTKSLELFVRDNQMQMQTIQMNRDILMNEISLVMIVDSNVVSALSLDSIFKRVTLNSEAVDYNWKLDSINIQMQRLTYKQQDLQDRRLSVGLMSSVGDFNWPRKYNYGVFAEFTQGFSAVTTTPHNSTARRLINPQIKTTLNENLEDYKTQTKINLDQTDLVVKKILERLKLGERGILQEIPQNLNLMINQQLNYYILRNKVLQNQLSQLRTLDQLPESWRPKW